MLILVEGALGLSWTDDKGISKYDSPIVSILNALQVDDNVFTIWLGK